MHHLLQSPFMRRHFPYLASVSFMKTSQRDAAAHRALYPEGVANDAQLRTVHLGDLAAKPKLDPKDVELLRGAFHYRHDTLRGPESELLAIYLALSKHPQSDFAGELVRDVTADVFPRSLAHKRAAMVALQSLATAYPEHIGAAQVAFQHAATEDSCLSAQDAERYRSFAQVCSERLLGPTQQRGTSVGDTPPSVAEPAAKRANIYI